MCKNGDKNQLKTSRKRKHALMIGNNNYSIDAVASDNKTVIGAEGNSNHSINTKSAVL